MHTHLCDTFSDCENKQKKKYEIKQKRMRLFWFDEQEHFRLSSVGFDGIMGESQNRVIRFSQIRLPDSGKHHPGIEVFNRVQSVNRLQLVTIIACWLFEFPLRGEKHK